MSKNLPIGFFDSGVGGLSVYAAFRELMPNENTIYYGDLKNLPYGNKTKYWLKKRTLNLIKFLKEKYHADYIIVACNTASTAIEDIKLDNALTNQLSQYLIRNGDIYKEDKNYAKAITYYERVPEGSSLHIAAQYSITECQNFISPPKIKKSETKTNSASNKKKAEQTKSTSNTKTTSKKTTDS